MHKRGLKVALVAVLTLIFVLGAVGVAFAQWSDLTMSILGDYGVTEQQVANISDGFVDGSWQPYKAMPRKQFVKMAVDAYKIPLVSPATPTYSDVPASDDYYAYIEGATAAGLTNGVGGGKMEPNTIITREQAVAIIARWVADKNGYNLETMYTDADAAAILGAYPDASAVGPSLQKEMAFAVDFGIVWGDASGKLAPKANMSRIQGAAMLIRSLDIIPLTEPVVPAKIELVSTDEAENLIGLTHQYTYKVTQADGSPAPGVLVDFDTLTAVWYVGNIQPAAALTDANGEVTVNLISTEVGIERVSAAAPGVAAIWSTKYWLALDEVYILHPTREAQNNAGTTHTWSARVLVFGPGPLSTSQSDWYNLYDPTGDPTHPLGSDGIDAFLPYGDDYTQYSDEVDWLADGYLGRSMAGIPVFWSIFDTLDDPDTHLDESLASVGTIVAATEDGEIAADGKSAWANTDADGLTTVDITSDVTGVTQITASANYEGNPYEWQLFNHGTNQFANWWHNTNWDDQPAPYAYAYKTWIPHVIGGGGDSPISPAYTEGNLGEEFTLTIHLEDVYGNAVTGRQVEWFMQGIGHFVTDDENTVTDPTDPAGNHDLDITDANGDAQVFVKSLDAGEQIVHAKVRDKGIDGHEGSFITYTAEVQWFDVNVATFDDPTTIGSYDHFGDWSDENEALASNPVGTSHDFTLHVYGLKLEYDPFLELNWPGISANQSPIIDTDYSGSSYDGIFDWKDAAYLGGILLVNDTKDGRDTAAALGCVGSWPEDLNGNGIIDPGTSEEGDGVMSVQGRDIVISGAGGYTEFDWNKDGYKEPFTGQTGIYLPLAGKDVTYKLVDNEIGPFFDQDGIHASVGSFTPAKAVTDANGEAKVTVTSNQKGPETVEATVDWAGNPHNGPELVKAYAKKIWVAGTAVKIVVSIDGTEVANNIAGEINDAPVNKVWVTPDAMTPPNAIDTTSATTSPTYGKALNHANIQVHVYDQFGNDLPDYEVVYLLENLGTTLQGSQDSADTYLPLAYFMDRDILNTIGGVNYDTNGTRPDHDEPMLSDDPYAPIVGDGGTNSFYFNQWLGAGSGLTSWSKNVSEGMGLYDYFSTVDATTVVEPGYVKLPPKAGSVFENYVDANGVGLLTDGAKAWTMDGYYNPDGIMPNLLTGSNVDIQLAEDPAVAGEPHAKSIVKVMVYAPHDGLVLGGTPIWEYQVHKVWYAPIATTITMSPARQIAVAGVDVVSTSATVLDQYGNPMAGASVDFASTEGDESSAPGALGGGTYSATTNSSGVAVWNIGQSTGEWGIELVNATSGSASSAAPAVIDWALKTNTTQAYTTNGSQVLHISLFTPSIIDAWDGLVVAAYLNPLAAEIGHATYDASNYLNITTSHTFATGQFWYANAAASTDADGAPNWLYGVTP